MTTAHRPTWKAAVGKASEGGWTAGGAATTAISALDVAAHTKLKTRQGKQVSDPKQALRESLLALEQAEQKATASTKKGLRKFQHVVDERIEAEGRQKLLTQTADVDEEALKKKYDDEDEDDDNSKDSDGFSDVKHNDSGSDLDASDSDDSDDDNDDDDSEDEELALQAELAKIRAEREAAKQRAAAKAAAEEEAKLSEAAMIGNPLLVGGGEGGAEEESGKLKRRWNDDVVFRNQAKGEPKLKKRFINDTVRNDFHKRFLNKFIR